MQVLPQWKGQIVTYSARRRYRLDLLMTAMVEAAATSRRWSLEQRADVADMTDGMDPRLIAFLKQSGSDLGNQGTRPWLQG